MKTCEQRPPRVDLFSFPFWASVICGLSWSLAATGCGSKAAEKVLKDAKAKVAATATAAQNNVANQVSQVSRPTATLFELKIENVKDPLKVTQGKAEVAVLENRPVVVNFTSAAGRDTSSFPNVLVTIHGKGAKLADLVGKSHPARIFVQLKQGQPMYFTQRDKPAEVTVEAGDEMYVTAKFEKAELFDTTGQETISLSGKLIGLIPQPPKPAADPKKAGDKAKGGAH